MVSCRTTKKQPRQAQTQGTTKHPYNKQVGVQSIYTNVYNNPSLLIRCKKFWSFLSLNKQKLCTRCNVFLLAHPTIHLQRYKILSNIPIYM